MHTPIQPPYTKAWYIDGYMTIGPRIYALHIIPSIKCVSGSINHSHTPTNIGGKWANDPSDPVECWRVTLTVIREMVYKHPINELTIVTSVLPGRYRETKTEF